MPLTLISVIKVLIIFIGKDTKVARIEEEPNNRLIWMFYVSSCSGPRLGLVFIKHIWLILLKYVGGYFGNFLYLDRKSLFMIFL